MALCTDTLDVLVIGAGQAGLVLGYHQGAGPTGTSAMLRRPCALAEQI